MAVWLSFELLAEAWRRPTRDDRRHRASALYAHQPISLESAKYRVSPFAFSFLAR